MPKDTTYTITLPREIALYNAIDQDLKDAAGDVVAALHIGTDGAGVITFTDFAATHSNVGGTFTINGRFAVGNDENTTPVTIPFAVQGTTTPYTVDVYFAQPDATNGKSGVYDPASGTISWTVRLNTNQTTVQNGKFTDAIQPGHP